jgi:hypothetical protein
MVVRVSRGLVALALAGALTTAITEARACPMDADDRARRLRERLDRERARADRWRLGWGIGFGVAAIGQGVFVIAEFSPLGEYDEAAEAALMAGTGKAIIGLGARVITPIVVPEPKVTGDPCTDLASAEAALAVAARSEKQSFWLNHLGGLAVQLGATLYIGLTAEDAWDDAAISFAVGYTVGVSSTYTQPRAAWHEHRRSSEARTWQVAPLLAPHARGLAVVGRF